MARLSAKDIGSIRHALDRFDAEVRAEMRAALVEARSGDGGVAGGFGQDGGGGKSGGVNHQTKDRPPPCPPR